MNYYQDLILLPDEEVPIFFIRNKIYQKLHKAIFDLNANDIGVSFPNVVVNKKDKIPNLLLGNKIRIHSTKNTLDELQNLSWIGGLSGYCKISETLPVPDKIKGYQTISRIRQTMTNAKLKNRIEYQKNNGDLKTDKDIQEYRSQYLAKMFKTSLDNPYLELSSSKGGLYRIYLHFGEIQNNDSDGEFNNFGLSKTATVPIF
jgi:CRISPR-associated endonuclease Csy4